MDSFCLEVLPWCMRKVYWHSDVCFNKFMTFYVRPTTLSEPKLYREPMETDDALCNERSHFSVLSSCLETCIISGFSKTEEKVQNSWEMSVLFLQLLTFCSLICIFHCLSHCSPGNSHGKLFYWQHCLKERRALFSGASTWLHVMMTREFLDLVLFPVHMSLLFHQHQVSSSL